MMALSILQPWAWLIANGHKDIENRTWTTRFRGPVLVHAGKGFDREGLEWIKSAFPHLAIPAAAEFQRGGIVGMVEIIDCVSAHASPWFFGPRGFVLEHGRPLPFFPARGRLGFFAVDLESTT